MADSIVGREGDRLLIRLDPGGPVELTGLTESFGALARMYERHYRPEKKDDGAPKLFVTRLASGSILAEIAPYVEIFGAVMTLPSAAVTIGDFSKRLNDGLRAFAGMMPAGDAALPLLSADDARDLKHFVSPLIGRKGAGLGITHARYSSKGVGISREVVVEYDFDETELNRAAINIDKALEAADAAPDRSSRPYNEVMLFFEAASRGSGRETGRTRDFAIVPEVSKKALPTYFRTGIEGNIKAVMVRGSTNPLSNVAYIVDLHAQMVDGEPRGYLVTNVHRSITLGGEEGEEDLPDPSL